MGISFHNPLNTVKSAVHHIGDAGKFVANATKKAVTTTVHAGERAIPTAEHAALQTLKFEANITRFALEKSFDGTKAITSGALRLGGRGINSLTHPGNPNPPAARASFPKQKAPARSLIKETTRESATFINFPTAKIGRSLM